MPLKRSETTLKKPSCRRLEQAVGSGGGSQRSTKRAASAFPQMKTCCLTSEESRAAEELSCPLHGRRIPAGVFSTYRAAWQGNDREDGWSNHSLQYRRAMAATYDYLEGRL